MYVYILYTYIHVPGSIYTHACIQHTHSHIHYDILYGGGVSGCRGATPTTRCGRVTLNKCFLNPFFVPLLLLALFCFT